MAMCKLLQFRAYKFSGGNAFVRVEGKSPDARKTGPCSLVGVALRGVPK